MKKPSVSFAVASTVVCLTSIASAAGWVMTTVTGSNLVGETHVVKAGLVKSTALQSFSFEFSNGDHKIRKIGLLPSVDRVDVAMTDNDGGDPFKFNAQYATIPWSASSTRVSKSCTGPCQLDITHKIASNDKMSDQVFVLRGFSFEREGTDTNVRRISSRPNVSQKKIDVIYKDNAATKYTVTIEYTLLGKDLLLPVATATGARKNNEETLKVSTTKAPGAQAILQGFDVEFDNGDHHLKQFAIKRTKGAYNVMFNDQNTDDPYRVTIDYAGVKD